MTHYTGLSPTQLSALRENKRGHATLQYGRGEKGPDITGWQNTKPLATDAEVLDKHAAPGANVGVVLGKASGNLVDVDHDDRRTMAFSDIVGLTSAATFGRKNKPRGHRLFRLPEDQSVNRITFEDPNPPDGEQAMMLEIRGTGHQTMWVGSVHPSGEMIEWDSDGDIPVWDLADMKPKAGLVAGMTHITRRLKDGNRHDPLMYLAGALLHAGHGEDLVRELVVTAGELSGGDDFNDYEGVVDSSIRAYKSGGKLGGLRKLKTALGLSDDDVKRLRGWFGGVPEPEDDRDVIKLNVDNVNIIGDRIVDLLQKRNDPPAFFTDANGEPVAVRIQADGTPTIDHFTDHQFREFIMRSIKFESPGKSTRANPNPEPVERTVSLDIVRNVLGRRNLPFPLLIGIANAPSFAADGTIRLRPGYDPATRTYLHPIGGVDFSDPALERDPTPDDVQAAVGLLDEMIAGFPFAGEADRAHALAGIIQQVGADLIDGRFPLLAYDKPAPGTGATLLVATTTAPFTGPTGVAGMRHPKNDEEFEKTLVAKYRQGSRYAFFDNVAETFGTPTIAEALTARFMELRLLGVNQTVRARMPTFWYQTSNNTTYTNELIRRVVTVRLDAKVARPAERTGFTHELPSWAWENRVRIIRAVLTLWKAWLAAGRPMGTRTLGSFESWSRSMGGVLDVAGVSGFLANTADFYDRADVEGAAWQAAIDAWWDEFGSDAVTVRELVTLPAVTEGFAVGMSDKDKKSFGIKLRYQRDRQYGDLRVTVAGRNRDKVQTYQLQHREGVMRPRRKHDAAPGDVINLFRKQS